jgi:hypothetical protein
MTPIDMTQIHDPEKEIYGDCYRACLASLLELSPDVFPAPKSPDLPTEEWHKDYKQKLREYGIYALSFEVDKHIETWFKLFKEEGIKIYHTLTGDSPRFPGTSHSVVACNGEIVHDPHPSRAGLQKITHVEFYLAFVK